MKNDIEQTTQEQPEEKIRKIAAEVLKGLGLVIVFVCWVVEHTKISGWEFQNEKYRDAKLQVLHDITALNINQAVAFDNLLRRDSSLLA